MNAHSNPAKPARDTDRLAATRARVTDDTATTPATAPVCVWRLADDSTLDAATYDDTKFVSRLARRLVLTYTRRRDAILDFDGDTALRDAATATTRTYVALTDRARITAIDNLTRPASLTVLHWPRPTSQATPAAINDLLLGLQFIVSATSSVLAVISTIAADHTSSSAAPQVAALLTAAPAAHFTHEQRILALGGDEDRDIYTFHPSDADADADLNRWRATRRLGARIDILRPATRTHRDG
jgi:hypothetical protein